MKKTFKVQDLKDKINQQLQHSTADKEFRYGLISIIEQVLHETGNYQGWKHLEQRDVPSNHLPGIRWINEESDFTNCDGTRRRYF